MFDKKNCLNIIFFFSLTKIYSLSERLPLEFKDYLIVIDKNYILLDWVTV